MEETLNQGQQAALKLAIDRYKSYEKYTYIAGPAGSGKSFLVQHIISALGLDPELDVCYAAYTGKAALNLQRKNCPNACTLHSLLYTARQNKETGLYYFLPKPFGGLQYKLIVIDEISMVTQEMWDLLVQHNVHLLVLGDIAQLPAIGTTNEIVNKPTYALTEIMRQEADSEIIQIATLAREHKEIPYMKSKNVQVLSRQEYMDSMLDWADITICATNSFKNQLNTIARQRKWGTNDHSPKKGDKIVCLHNEWNCYTKADDILVNGLVGYIVNTPKAISVPKVFNRYGYDQYYSLDFVPDFREPGLDTIFRNLKVDQKLLTTGTPTITQKNFKYISKSFRPYQFDYAYAMSCWKCQGSEYGKVLLFEEKFPYGEAHWQ